jgi:hypothetical protein
MEIEELKNELTTITLTKTSISGRDRWDTPEIKLPNGKKGKLLKDRYSSLVIANMLARQISRADAPPAYHMIGGAVPEIDVNAKRGHLYDPNGWWHMPDGVCRGISRS